MTTFSGAPGDRLREKRVSTDGAPTPASLTANCIHIDIYHSALQCTHERAQQHRAAGANNALTIKKLKYSPGIGIAVRTSAYVLLATLMFAA
jgi:hypothetical protein